MGGVAEKEVGLTETRWGTTRGGGNRERRYNFMLEHRVFAAELYFVETSEILTEVITFVSFRTTIDLVAKAVFFNKVWILSCYLIFIRFIAAIPFLG